MIYYGHTSILILMLLIELLQLGPRQLRINLIHQPVIKRNYAKCGLLYQLVDILNSLQINPNDTILAKIYEKSHSYNGFAFNVTRIYLDTYDPVSRFIAS